jgi:hypothetical protein
MKFPAFSLLAGNFGFRDGFARDCPLQRRVTCEPEPGAAEIGSGENDVGGDDADADLSGTVDGRFPSSRQMLARENRHPPIAQVSRSLEQGHILRERKPGPMA